MGQVPAADEIPYLIVGNGKLAKHIVYYFRLMDISFRHWYRQSDVLFEDAACDVSKILLLISDDAIEHFINQNKTKAPQNVTWIHCSGALSSSLAESAHPLMTFTEKLYGKDEYLEIPFITEAGRKTFTELFPELPNKNYQLPGDVKTLYHAWCSVSGNFTSILWTEFFKRLEKDFNLPREAAYPYLKQITSNIMTESDPVTGPLKRGDSETIKKHIASLEDDEFVKIYKAFTEVYETKNNLTGNKND